MYFSNLFQKSESFVHIRRVSLTSGSIMLRNQMKTHSNPAAMCFFSFLRVAVCLFSLSLPLFACEKTSRRQNNADRLPSKYKQPFHGRIFAVIWDLHEDVLLFWCFIFLALAAESCDRRTRHGPLSSRTHSFLFTCHCACVQVCLCLCVCVWYALCCAGCGWCGSLLSSHAFQESGFGGRGTKGHEMTLQIQLLAFHLPLTATWRGAAPSIPPPTRHTGNSPREGEGRRRHEKRARKQFVALIGL